MMAYLDLARTPAGKKPKILLVDDHDLNLELLEAYLAYGEYEIHMATDGAQALEIIKQDPPDLIILDVMMPRINGFEVCEKVKENSQTRLIPIILLTALKEEEVKIRGIKAGAEDFLTKPVSKAELQARVTSLLKLKKFTDELESAENVIMALAMSIEAKDTYTEGHCERLAKHSVELGKQIGLSEEHLLDLYRGGILHDIGKIGVPDAVLLKPGRLTDEEFEVIKKHPVIGVRLCDPLKSLKNVIPIIRHHHEKLDGSGYPDGLKGNQIPITARVLSIIDVFDALTSHRPYREALSPRQAMEILEAEVGKGWWDGDLVNEFGKMILRNS